MRGHFAFVEDWLNAPPGADRQTWFDRFASGQLVGNAWTETGDVALGQTITKVSEKNGRLVLNGRKFYSTGSLFADWIDVFAQRADDGRDVIVAVSTAQPGVIREDDWDGFGQTTTGSGTTRFEDATVDARDVIDFARRFKYQTAFYQLFHVATLAGIGHAIVRDAGDLRRRTRVQPRQRPRAADDAQLQQVIGEIASWAYAADALAARRSAAATGLRGALRRR